MDHCRFKKSNAKPPKTKDCSGGERVSVSISVNEKIEFSRSAILDQDCCEDESEYKTSDGKSVKHRRSDGSKSLAEKLLNK